MSTGSNLPAGNDGVIDLHLARTLVPLKAMTDRHLSELLQHCQIEMVFRGDQLFDRGDFDRQHLYLLYGDVELLHASGQTSIQKGRESLLPLAHQQPRQCRALAKTDCSVLRIDSEALDKMLSWSQVAEYLLLDVSYQRDLDEDVDWIMTVLKSNLFFKVPPINVGEIFSRLEPRVVSAGDVILRQGEIGDCCYFIKEGEARVTHSDDGVSQSQWLADIAVGRCFGEDALVNETVRNATVTMTTNGVLMSLDKQAFFRLLKEPRVDVLSSDTLENSKAGELVVVDVRTEDEYAAGHLEKAVNIPLNLLRIKIRLLNKNSRYLLYCDTARRSRAAAYLLAAQGFNAYALDGGLTGLPEAQRGSLLIGSEGYVLRDGVVVQGQ